MIAPTWPVFKMLFNKKNFKERNVFSLSFFSLLLINFVSIEFRSNPAKSINDFFLFNDILVQTDERHIKSCFFSRVVHSFCID